MFLRFGTNENTKGYCDSHWKYDVLLSADVFEKFGNNSLKNYGLRSSHYLSVPALSWDAVLNMTTVELELITDHDMYIIFEKGIKVEFFIFLLNIVKPTTSIWNLTTQKKN